MALSKAKLLTSLADNTLPRIKHAADGLPEKHSSDTLPTIQSLFLIQASVIRMRPDLYTFNIFQ